MTSFVSGSRAVSLQARSRSKSEPLIDLPDASSIDELESCDGATEHVVRLLRGWREGRDILTVSFEQFELIIQIIFRCPRVLGKPRFSYFGKDEVLFVKRPSHIHEHPIRTLNSMLRKEGLDPPFPEQVVRAQVHHNKELLADEVICQIGFSQIFKDAQNEIRTLVNTDLSISIAIIIDIVEHPPVQESSTPE